MRIVGTMTAVVVALLSFAGSSKALDLVGVEKRFTISYNKRTQMCPPHAPTVTSCRAYQPGSGSNVCGHKVVQQGRGRQGCQFGGCIGFQASVICSGVVQAGADRDGRRHRPGPGVGLDGGRYKLATRVSEFTLNPKTVRTFCPPNFPTVFSCQAWRLPDGGVVCGAKVVRRRRGGVQGCQFGGCYGLRAQMICGGLQRVEHAPTQSRWR